MPRTVRKDTELHWDERGRRSDPTVLLIMGLGAQMTAFREEFCDELAARGHHVVRFDNRDAGLSTTTPGDPPTQRDLARLVALRGRGVHLRYTLGDMADDAVAVLDATGTERAHVVGVSMGGMIAQRVSIQHPTRVASMTSIMSKTGATLPGRPTPQVFRRLLEPRPTHPAAALRHELERTQLVAGPLFDLASTQAHLESSYERSFTPNGLDFQLAAILADGDRTKALRNVTAPTLVIHGRADPLVQPSGGVATARAVPGSSLVVHDLMGHQLATPFWPAIIDDISAHVRRAEARRPSAR